MQKTGPTLKCMPDSKTTSLGGKMQMMKKWWMGIFLGVATIVTLAIFVQVSHRTREVHRDMVQFFQHLEKKQYERLYTQWTTELYRKRRSLAQFVQDIQVLSGPHTLKVRELFVSFRRSTLRGEILTQQGRSYAIEFYVRKPQHRHQVYDFRMQESVDGVATTFFSLLQKQRWNEAHVLMSASFRQQVPLSQLPAWAGQHRIEQWQSFSWSMVDNYSKIGKVIGLWRSKLGKMARLSVSLFREQNRWQIGHVQIQPEVG